MVYAKDFLFYLQGLPVVFQRLQVVALVIVYRADIVVGEGGVGMVFAEDFLTYHQCLPEVFQRLRVVALFPIHQTDIVVGGGGVGMVFGEDFLFYRQGLPVVFQRLRVVALVIVHRADIVVGGGGGGMVFAEDFLFYRQGLPEVFQRLWVVALGIIHQADIVVRRGGGGMVITEDFLIYRQGLPVVFQRLRVVALGIVHHADFVVRGGGILIIFAIQILGERYLPEPDRFGIVIHAVLIKESGIVKQQVAIFLFVVVGLGGPAVGFLVDTHHFDDTGRDELAIVGEYGWDLRQQVVDGQVNWLLQLRHFLLILLEEFIGALGCGFGLTCMAANGNAQMGQNAHGELIFDFARRIALLPKDAVAVQLLLKGAQAGVFLFIRDAEEVNEYPMSLLLFLFLFLLEGTSDGEFMAGPLAGLGFEDKQGDVAVTEFLVDDFLVVAAEVACVKIFALDNPDHDFVVAEDVADVLAEGRQVMALVLQFGDGRGEEYFDKLWVVHIRRFYT